MDFALYFFASFLSVFVWFSFPGKVLTYKKDKIWFTILMIILNLAELVIALLVPPFNDNPIRTVIYFAQYLIYIFIAYKEPPRLKAMVFAISIMSISLAEFTALLIAAAIGIDLSVKVNGISVRSISIIFCAVLSYFIYIVLSSIYNKIKNKHFSNKLWQFQIIVFSQFLMIVAVSYSIFLNANLESAVMRKPGFAVFLFLALLVSVIGDVCLYRILNTNSQNYELKNELEIMQTKNKLELEYYEKLKKNIAETRKMNHDFNNILTVIQRTINSSDSNENKDLALKTVEELKETLAKNKVRNYCENELVNLIVISKSEDIIGEGIDFSTNLNIPQNINVKNSDLCRVFTNLLDNAKEACLMSENKEKAFIVLSSQIKDNLIYITSENYYDTVIEKKNDRFISSKEKHKGLGIAIIKEIAKNYDGDFVCDYDDNVFTATVSLKIN